MLKLKEQRKLTGTEIFRLLSDRAYDVYANTDPFEIYAIEGDADVAYSTQGAYEWEDLTAEELNEYLEELWDGIFRSEV